MYIDKELKKGYNTYIDVEKDDYGTQMDVGVLVLEKGETYTIKESEKETALVLLEGMLKLRFSDEEKEISRTDMFHQEAWCLLAPRRSEISLEAQVHCEIYIQKTKNECDYKPKLFAPKDVQIQQAGSNGELGGCMRREIKTFFDYDNAPYSNMVLGEVLNYPGKWSSYPPHHHPQPEVYLHRFDHAQGFGASFAGGKVYTSRHNGLSIITHDFHSQVAAPGYAMCYLWGIRHLEENPWKKTRIDDEEHKWLQEADAEQHIYPASSRT